MGNDSFVMGIIDDFLIRYNDDKTPDLQNLNPCHS